MKIQLICVGKVREKYLKLGIEEFEKRLTPYVSLSTVEIRDRGTRNEPNEAEIRKILDDEGKDILKRIDPADLVVALDIEGRSMDSVKFSKWLSGFREDGIQNLVMIIGGSHGLSPEVLSRANERLSFSKMTFPHQMMRLILLEQIYRAYRIDAGHPYHK